MSKFKHLLAEFAGTAVLLCAVIGSGIMAEQLAQGNTAVALLANTLATVFVLYVLIETLGPVSGAHFNPVVTIADRVFHGIPTREVVPYIAAQVLGMIVGVMVANLMFGLTAIDISTKTRSGGGLWLGEIVATLGLLLVIFGVVRSGKSTLAPFVVAGYITAAYFFTSSTSFANPAITIGRSLSDSFAGIAPRSAPGFIVAQFIGMALALVAIRIVFPDVDEFADELLMKHEED
jgi:arsenate reductase